MEINLKQRIIFRRMIQSIIIMAIFLMGITTMSNENDIFWQLKMGEEIVQQHHFPTKDHYSLPAYGEAWTLHEWVASVIFYLLYHQFGWNALIFLKATIVATTFGLFLLLFNRLKVNLYLSFFVLILATMVNTRGIWVVFPSIFEYLFLVMTLFILECTQTYGWRTVLALSLLSLLWANTHSSFFLLTIILGAYIFGSLIAEKLKKRQPAYQPQGFILNYRQRLRLTVAMVVSLLTPFLTPNGYETFIYPFRISFGRFTPYVGEYQKYWQVWQWNWADYVHGFTLILIVTLMILFFLARKKIHPTDLGLAVVFIGLAQLAVRHVAIFSLVALFLIAKYLRVWFGEYRGIFKRSLVKDTLLILFVLSFIYYYKSKIVSFGLGASEADYPQKAAEFINHNKIPGNMFNHYNYGGYLIWKMPDYKVFIDGRLEMYLGQAGQDYLTIMEARSGYQNLIEKYKINFFLDYMTDAIVANLIADPDWKLIFISGQYVVLVKNTDQNKDFISRYWSKESEDKVKEELNNVLADNLNNLGIEAVKKKQWSQAIEYFRQSLVVQPQGGLARLNLARVLTDAGLWDEATKEYQQILLTDPNNQQAKIGLIRIDKLKSWQPTIK